ncbi:hypothetical protein NTGHW29_380034 [Candidatus Nitrotoga sp. HW29]|uniref:hypothetical protein n=1 Tax=Candidatus Nitrotoga sp. HW29 TaxID=2886963 RepID=UPI001EF3ABF5|nr:hypothetical protein [Candidatus Nitrotoga sp. HW29]CAH1904842.1 hypothetical protein NTGHW29_380034 [Candidatus Nitrotoga sp. HW29]
MRTLICGVGVQDGASLPILLLEDEYEVIGSSRDAMTTSFSNLTNLVILDKVIAASMAISDFHSIRQNLVKAEYPWNLKTRRNFD